jgi:hypothetical protein
MQSTVWVQLLRHLPPEQHPNLLLVTKAGTEIAVQNILRLDHEFIALRGRLAGSADGHRLFVVPYAQIDYLASQQAWSEADYHACFDGLTFEAPGEPAAAAAPEPEPAAPLAPEAGAVAPSSRTPPPPIKSAVLERFRSRSATLPGVKLNLPQPPDS